MTTGYPTPASGSHGVEVTSEGPVVLCVGLATRVSSIKHVVVPTSRQVVHHLAMLVPHVPPINWDHEGGNLGP